MYISTLSLLKVKMQKWAKKIKKDNHSYLLNTQNTNPLFFLIRLGKKARPIPNLIV